MPQPAKKSTFRVPSELKPMSDGNVRIILRPFHEGRFLPQLEIVAKPGEVFDLAKLVPTGVVVAPYAAQLAGHRSAKESASKGKGRKLVEEP